MQGMPGKTDGGTNPAVYQRDERRSLFLAADQWTDAYLSLQSLQTFFMQGMSVTNCIKSANVDRIRYLPNPKPGHTTGRSGRGGAWRRGGAGRSWIGRDAVGRSGQETILLLALQRVENNALNDSAEARTI